MSFASSMAGRSYANSAGGGYSNASTTAGGGMSYGTMAGIGAIGSTISSLSGIYMQGVQNEIAGYNRDIERYRAKTNAAIAKVQGKQTALALNNAFNKTMASNAVLSAAQMRRGGSVTQIANAAEDQYNWDLDFADMSNKIQEIGLDALASYKQYTPSMGETMAGGVGKAMAPLQSYTQNMSLIGGIK